MRAVALGTGSGRPTLKRNVSAVAVVWEDEWILFDCGESTQIQILRADLSMSRLAAIFITHLHGDHFNGLPGLLSTIGLNGRQRELTIVGPPGIRAYLELLGKLRVVYVNYPLQVREFPEQSFKSITAIDGAQPPFSLLCVFETARYTISACPLEHRLYALGYRVEVRARPGRFDIERARALRIPEGPLFGRLQSGNDVTLADGRVIHPSDVLGPPRPGRTFSYCTDTRPCSGSVLLSQNVNLMIHEATFADDLREEAHEYGHSTSAQAAQVAAAARPERLLITHISSRYPDASILVKEAREFFKETDIAHDLMEMPV